MDRSDADDNKDAIIFILAMLFLAVVLISLGASVITYNVMKRKVTDIVAADELTEDELMLISKNAVDYIKHSQDAKETQTVRTSAPAQETIKTETVVFETGTERIETVQTGAEVDEEGIIKKTIDAIKSSFDTKVDTGAYNEYVTNQSTIINQLEDRVRIVGTAGAKDIKPVEGVLYFYTE